MGKKDKIQTKETDNSRAGLDIGNNVGVSDHERAACGSIGKTILHPSVQKEITTTLIKFHKHKPSKFIDLNPKTGRAGGWHHRDWKHDIIRDPFKLMRVYSGKNKAFSRTGIKNLFKKILPHWLADFMTPDGIRAKGKRISAHQFKKPAGFIIPLILFYLLHRLKIYDRYRKFRNYKNCTKEEIDNSRPYIVREFDIKNPHDLEFKDVIEIKVNGERGVYDLYYTYKEKVIPITMVKTENTIGYSFNTRINKSQFKTFMKVLVLDLWDDFTDLISIILPVMTIVDFISSMIILPITRNSLRPIHTLYYCKDNTLRRTIELFQGLYELTFVLPFPSLFFNTISFVIYTLNVNKHVMQPINSSDLKN